MTVKISVDDIICIGSLPVTKYSTKDSHNRESPSNYTVREIKANFGSPLPTIGLSSLGISSTELIYFQNKTSTEAEAYFNV